MRKLLFIGLLVGALTCLASPALAAEPLSVKVTAEPAQLETVLGGRFMITTEVTNTGTAPSGEVLAHLNVASIEGSVYVDPEDWSSDRSQELSLQPGESQKLSWELQAVNAGHFAAYVAVVPSGSNVAGHEDIMISPLVSIAVASRSTLTAQGALPIVISIPLLLGLAAAGVFFAARRSRLESMKPDS
jgi:hypothetical protein